MKVYCNLYMPWSYFLEYFPGSYITSWETFIFFRKWCNFLKNMAKHSWYGIYSCVSSIVQYGFPGYKGEYLALDPNHWLTTVVSNTVSIRKVAPVGVAMVLDGCGVCEVIHSTIEGPQEVTALVQGDILRCVLRHTGPSECDCGESILQSNSSVGDILDGINRRPRLLCCVPGSCTHRWVGWYKHLLSSYRQSG